MNTVPRLSLAFVLVFVSPVNPESGNVVSTLITNRHEPPGGIDGEYSWIIPER